MKISVVGTGHVGLVTAACMAHIGHEVLGIDEDGDKIARIRAGVVPFLEPGLPEMVNEGLASGRLRMSTEVADAARETGTVFVCVGTPTLESGEPDLRQVKRVARTLAAALVDYVVVVEKSTVPAGTGAAILATLREVASPSATVDVASNPEFLQEGHAIRDTLEPTRIVVGADSDRAVETLRRIYRPILDRSGCPFIVTDIPTAELVKHSNNAFLATKISFINLVADICERANADVETVAMAMGLDPRIGSSFLHAGLGYGGECLPKDVQAYRYAAEQLGADFSLLAEVDRINRERQDRFVEKIEASLGGLHGKHIAIWGLAFKAGTDDLRHAPAINVAQRLCAAGASVTAYDPVAVEEAQSQLPEVGFASGPYGAAQGADALAICTDWPEFAEADLGRLRAAMARPIVIDGRNMLDPKAMEDAGFLYMSTGRPTVRGSSPA